MDTARDAVRPAGTMAADAPTRPGGKGRPTPKRREAEQQRRQRAAAPRDRKEAARLARERARQQRATARAGLLSGDERSLPARDRGPVKRFVRDYVDARRNVAELFLPVAFLVLVLSFVRIPLLVLLGSYAWMVMIVLIGVDSYVLRRRLRRELVRRFPREDLRGTTSYGLLRSLQFRRLRLPKPQVRRGAKVGVKV